MYKCRDDWDIFQGCELHNQISYLNKCQNLIWNFSLQRIACQYKAYSGMLGAGEITFKTEK